MHSERTEDKRQRAAEEIPKRQKETGCPPEMRCLRKKNTETLKAHRLLLLFLLLFLLLLLLLFFSITSAAAAAGDRSLLTLLSDSLPGRDIKRRDSAVDVPLQQQQHLYVSKCLQMPPE